MGHLKSVSFSLAAILPFLTLTADAADYIVSPGMSIQAAIDAAADGDRILVQPGTYSQRLDFTGKRLEVRGIAGAEFTILDGTAIANCLVQAGQAEPLGTLLAGFTLTNGRGRGFASSYGQDYYGGAIWTGGGSKLTVEDCHIVHNGWNSGGYNNCTFAGGVYSGGSQITLRRCLIADNFAWACGGATLVDGTGSLILFDRCTIVSNASTDFFGPQGGIGMANDGDVIVRDSIVWNNYGNQIDAFGYPYNIGCTASVDYCCVQGGYAGVGNISLNPQLAQWSPLDARLTLGSPCIDSGDPLAPTDLDGTRRDMGAFPFLGGGIQGFCFGDGSIGACPCSNQGTASQGCANAVNPAGALLSPSGALSTDTLTLNASGLPGTAPCIFLQGTIRIVPSAFGDGILCTGGVLNRLAVKAASSGSAAYPTAGESSIRARSAQLGDTLQPGAVRQYQVYYRDAQVTFCPAPQGSTFNITNGVEVTWP